MKYILLTITVLCLATPAYADVTSSFLLMETGDKILKEDTGKILLNSMYIPPAATRSAIGTARSAASTRTPATTRSTRRP